MINNKFNHNRGSTVSPIVLTDSSDSPQGVGPLVPINDDSRSSCSSDLCCISGNYPTDYRDKHGRFKTPTGIARVNAWIKNETRRLHKCVETSETTQQEMTFIKFDYRKDNRSSVDSDSINPSDNSPKSNENNEHRNGLSDSPSPESRKKELYNYLKLMNPEDKPVVLPPEHRRSTRVKNLNIQIQKELDKKVQIESDRIMSPNQKIDINILRKKLGTKLTNTNDYITLKSFEDLGIKVDSLKYSMQSEKCFNFIMPPQNVLEYFKDFEDSILPLVNEKLTKIKEEKRKIEEHNSNEKRLKLNIEKIDHDLGVNNLPSSVNNGESNSKRFKNQSPINGQRKELQDEINSTQKENFIPFSGFKTDNEELSQKLSALEKCILLVNKPNSLTEIEPPDDLSNSQNIEPEETFDKDEVVGILTRGKFVNFDPESESSSESMDSELDAELTVKCDIVSPLCIENRNNNVLPFDQNVEMKSLHHSLAKRKTISNSVSSSINQEWDSDGSCQPSGSNKQSSHFITHDRDEYGSIQTMLYHDFNLIVVQEYGVSMWNQTALGNVLGAQNLWVSYGSIKRMILNKESVRKNSLEMTISSDSCVVYAELWTKEHKSDVREVPVADVFAVVYFWTQKANKIDKKVLQLENINGFADDVQYVALKNSLNLVVSWNTVVDRDKQTLVRIYTLANDFQTISKVRAIAKVDHYVSSLHNIEDCEELLMGCGENKVTLWNIEYGYIVATIELKDIKLSLNTLWAKCDRGILFIIQQCVDRELRLIAINGRNHSWKKLKSYTPPDGYERIQNVYIENGMLIAFYDEGLLCWKAQSEKNILEEIDYETDTNHFPNGRHLIIVSDDKIFVKHALTHVLL